MAFAAGTRIGVYEITGLIGVGGMGEVYKARDTRLDRIVAIKVLPEHIADDPDLRHRFEREAKAISSLSHPHICTLHDIGSAAGVEFLVMEYLEGESLAQRLAKGPLPLQQVLRYGVEIAEALDRAHRQGVTHRDLKPGNVMLTKAGAKLLDFGLAKLKPAALQREPGSEPTVSPDLTGSGTILGTLQYMAPEQVEGKAVDHRADIFAFGAILYEMATGKKAFEGGSQASLIGAILRDDPTPISALQPLSPPALDALVATCLAKDADDRWQSAGDLGRQLRLMQGSGQHGVALPPAVSSARSAWRLDPARALGALVAIAAFTAVALWIFGRPPPDAPRVTRFLLAPPTATPLASSAGVDVAISPDGSRIAYVASLGNGRMGLYVRELAQLEASLAATVREAPTVNPFFSADGRSIGYYSIGQGLFSVSTDGGSPLKLADDPVNFSGGYFTADGTLIFASGVALYRRPADVRGMPERLTAGSSENTSSDGDLVYVAPMLLPDERSVLFALVGQAGPRIAVLDTQTRERRVIAENAIHPSYSPSGHLLFVRGTTLMAAPFDLDRLAITREPVPVLEGIRRPSENSAPDYALSATGTLVYVPGENETNTLVWVDRGGRVVGPVVDDRIDNPREPRLSPDGRRVLVTTGPATARDLWIYDLAGRPPIPLVDDEDNGGGFWSHDGKQVALTRGNGATLDSYVVYRIPADGSARDPDLVLAERATVAAWSTEDELILNLRQPTDVVRVSIGDSDRVREIVATADAEGDASLSPDERWLAYTTDRTGRLEVWVKPLPDGNPFPISRDGGTEPLWSRDGRELFFRNGTAMLAVAVDAEASPAFGLPTQLFDLLLYDATTPLSGRSYDVAADGRFLMNQPANATAAGSAVVIENWTEELKRLVPTE
jgi:eukaryotic-like serine/threonine-protein kinase